MTLRQVFVALLQLIAVFAFFAAAVFLVALPLIPELRFSVAQILLEKPDLLAVAGIGLFGSALLMTMGFLRVGRGRYLLLQMGGKPTAMVDTNILHQSVAPLLRKQFAARIRLSNIEVIRGHHLQFGLDLASMDIEEREKLLLEAERHLQKLLSERFGYRGSFTVQAVIR